MHYEQDADSIELGNYEAGYSITKGHSGDVIAVLAGIVAYEVLATVINKVFLDKSDFRLATMYASSLEGDENEEG